MAFNSTIFIFLFAPLVFITNFLIPARASNLFILGACICFYGWGEPKFLFVVLASAGLDYGLGFVVARDDKPLVAKLALGTGVCANIGLLVYCKYSSFFLGTLGGLFGGLGFPLPEIFLPLGLSFIVFEKITYLVDIYRKTTPPARRATDYLFFVFFFPKMLAGPIIKYHDISAQIEARSVTLDDAVIGISRFIVGLAKKVLVADSMAGTVETIFSAPASQLGFSDAWLAALAFTVQIYFDFSGYSDMAIGLASLIGFRLQENFNQPYLAVGFTDFWRRWHISLSSWIRDYLYIPLGGNRRSPLRVFMNLWVCFIASGLWHGASWTFVFWGAYHGLFVWLDRVCLSALWSRVPRQFGIPITFFLVVIGWVFFRSRTVAEAADFVHIMFSPWQSSSLSYLGPTNDVYFFLALGLVASFVPLSIIKRLDDLVPGARFARLLVPLALAAWSFGHVFAATFTPFLYFRF
jgi:alginate O-acetyltransferase complex protein AlgI